MDKKTYSLVLILIFFLFYIKLYIKLPCGTSTPLLFCCFSSCVTDSILSTRSSANERVKTRANRNTLFCNLKKKKIRSEVEYS